MQNIIRSALSLLAAGILCLPASLVAGEAVKLRAHGNNPDWQLEIMEKGNSIRFTRDGTSATYRYGKLGPSLYRDKKTHVYRVLDKAHAMSVFVKSNACTDDVTGKSHEVTVIVAFDDQAYGGCGDVLTRLLEP